MDQKPSIPRRLRSTPSDNLGTVAGRSAKDEDTYSLPVHFVAAQPKPTGPDIKLISPGLSRLPAIDVADAQILRKKQRRLLASTAITRTAAADYGPHVAKALASTLIFAQHEAGTAVCIDPRGWIVTCAHCFGETDTEWRAQRHKWLLYYTGLAVQVECRAWDARRDLALAKVVRMELDEARLGGQTVPKFAFVPFASSCSGRDPLICIGQPGADDLESSSPRKTTYDLVEISEGRLRGMVPGADPHDNLDIGTLKHDAWTYWGHSGAPLLRKADGSLLGLHSSWDDNTAMRHGVPLVAIQEFLREHLPSEWIDLFKTRPSFDDRAAAEGPEVIVIDDSD